MDETKRYRLVGRFGRVALALGLLAGAVGGGSAGAGHATVAGAIPLASGGVFVDVDPVRVLDTRFGIGGQNGPLGSYDLQITGVNGVPAEATAVVLNMTATDASEVTYLTVQPSGQPPQNVSSANLGPGQTVANLVAVKIGTNGKVWIHNAAGTAHVIADLAGYFVPGSGSVGPAGPPGPAGDGMQFMGSTTTVTVTTIAGGLSGDVAMVPISGVLTTPVTFSEVAGTYDMTGSAPARAVAQVVSRDFTIEQVNATISLDTAMALVGVTITPEVTIWAVPASSNTATELGSVTCTGTGLTGVVATGTLSECSVGGLNVAVARGTRLFSVVSVTAAGITLNNWVNLTATVSIS